MARNRKRGNKERRSRRPQGEPSTQPGVATARPEHQEGSPDPIEHATPDVELAEAQLAQGRPELDEVPDPEELEEIEEADERSTRVPGIIPAGPHVRQDDGPPLRPEEAELAVVAAQDAEEGVELAPVRTGSRLVHFLQGSWRELQRVQWPDRRQVIQATGVVLGFVIVAGAYLGIADALAGKLMDFILK
ncbi:MAG TPA: preprotein translocase subunit SecE [Solirubrobacteraceae bacterium]|nr:preprotein translocase subunit SecE [Solirubrobacteraceae bacterium]